APHGRLSRVGGERSSYALERKGCRVNIRGQPPWLAGRQSLLRRLQVLNCGIPFHAWLPLRCRTKPGAVSSCQEPRELLARSVPVPCLKPPAGWGLDKIGRAS